MFRKTIASILMLAMVTSCASAKVKLLDKSKNKKPKWIITLPEDSSNVYFLGSKSSAPSFEYLMIG